LGAKASEPTVDNDGNSLLLGALYWNTTSNNMYVWEGSLWKQATGSIEGIREEFVFTSTAGQTVFSGLDDNGLTLVMDAVELVDVFLNGIKIVKGIDYTLDIFNNTVTFASGRTLNDIVSVHSFGNFTAATNSLNIVGGSVNGSPIGNTTADSGTFTNLTATGTTSVGTITGTSLTATQSATLQQAGSTKLQTTTTGVDVTGTVTADGLTVDGDSITANAQDAVTIEFSGAGGIISADRTGGNYGELSFKTTAGAAPLSRLKIAYNGDVSFYEDTGTTQKFYWDSSAESLGIGTDSPTALLDVVSTSNPSMKVRSNGGIVGNYAELTLQSFNSFSGSGQAFIRGVSSASGNSNTDLVFGTNDSGFGSPVERMRINNSGNVGIGTAAPSYPLHVTGVIGATGQILSGGGGAAATPEFSFTADNTLGMFRLPNVLGFSTGGTERMRIDSGGNLLVGTTSLVTGGYAARFNVQTAANTAIFKCTAAAGGGTSLQTVRDTDGGQVVFHQGGSAVGSISSTASGVTYSTTSDRRLKDNIKPIADATDKLMSMKPVTHTWIADPQAAAVVGFIAQEMQEIVPEAVTGNPEGEEMMSMDYGRITPVLVAALQDALRRIKSLEETLTELDVA